MCTLIALHQCVVGAPLVVAANRDEFLDRPAEGPALRNTPHGTILAPKDARAGGTWIGLNATGLFAAVTNRRGEETNPELRSRGLLVHEVLGAATAEQAALAVERLDAQLYNPFNLLVADGRTAHVISSAEETQRIDLEPGAHVIGNVHPLEVTPKIARLRDEVARAVEAPGARVLEDLARVCRGHDGDDPLASTCVHAGPYGTRSSTLLRLGAEPELRHAGGAPCTAAYDDFSPLLCELGLETGTRAGDTSVRKVS
jgi:uncharacterized protein with NRDE domain